MTDEMESIQEGRAYVGFAGEDERALAALRPFFEEIADDVVEQFYEAVTRMPELAAIIRKHSSVERLKKTQKAYFLRLTEGGYGREYVEERRRIGAAHETIGLDPQWYLGAYQIYANLLFPRLIARYGHAPATLEAMLLAVMKLMNLDAQIALDVYIARHQQALAVQREQLAVTLRSIGEGLITADRGGHIVLMNQVAEMLTGRAQADAQGRPLTELVPALDEDTGHKVRSVVSDVLGGGGTTTGEWRLMAQDGGRLTIEVTGAPICSSRRPAEGVVLILRNVTERKRAEQRRAVQHAVAGALAESPRIRVAMPKVLQAICHTLGWDVGHFWRVHQADGLLRLAYSYTASGVSAPAFEAASTAMQFAKGVGLPGRVWQAGQPLWIADAAEGDNFPRKSVAIDSGIHSAFAFPVQLGQDDVGVLEFFSRRVQPPDGDLLAAMTTLGSQVGQFVRRREAERALAQTSRELRATNRELEEMTSIVAHDLKAPLVTIQGFVERLESRCGAQLDDTGRRYLATLSEVSNWAGKMVASLMDLSRIQGRNFRRQPLDPAEVVRQVCHGLDAEIRATGAVVEMESSASGVSVQADPLMLYEVLSNLIGNAIKFAAPGTQPQVRVSAQVKPEAVVLSVRDNGIGIPANRQAEVFQIFRKLSKDTPGVGIGLAAVKKLVEKGSGTVWLESEVGKGTTVFLTLPQTQP